MADTNLDGGLILALRLPPVTTDVTTSVALEPLTLTLVTPDTSGAGDGPEPAWTSP